MSGELLIMGESRPGQTYEFAGQALPSFDDAVEKARNEPKDVMVHPILEPLKVRLISKGNTWRYWVSRFFQKGLWAHLQKFPQFKLTGKVLDPTDLLNLLGREKKIGVYDRFRKWVSGDYKAATDGLNIMYTKEAFEAALAKAPKGYGHDLLEVLRSVLYEQDLHYPSNSGVPPVNQTNGQLMGSTLSFPILCIVNLVCYWRALEEYLGRSVELEELPVLINGDDILFRTNDEFYQIWRKYIGNVGFILSLGKNYVHKNILTVNSTFYRHARDTIKGGQIYDRFELLGYLNIGLLIGQSKTGSGGSETVKPLWDAHNELIDWAVDPERASRRFIHYRLDEIKEATKICVNTTANLFLPFSRGGLGFNIPNPNILPQITSFQRKFAAFITQKTQNSLSLGVYPKTIMGIIKQRNSSQNLPKLHHIPHNLILLKPTDVLNVNQSRFVEKTFSPPALALDFEISNPKDLKVRRPHPRMLEEFRNAKLPRMSTKELLSGDISVVEEREIIPDPTATDMFRE